jgi:hypothetical protein
VSRTDPETTLVDRPDFGRHLAYKAHWAVGGRDGQVITAAVATTGAAADEHLLAEVLWQHHRLSGLNMREVVADASTGPASTSSIYGDLEPRPSFRSRGSGTCARTSGAVSTSGGCRTRTLTFVRLARSSGDAAKPEVHNALCIKLPRAAAPPVLSASNALRRGENEA